MAKNIDIPNGWEVKKLGEVFKKINIKNKDKLITQVLTNSAQYGVIAQEEFFDKSIATKENINTYYILNIDDFIYNPRISKFAPAGPISRNKYKIGCVSPLYTVFKMTANYNIDFYELYFKSNIWNRQAYNIANFGARFDRMNITDIDFFNMPIPVPPLAEQEKIAEILSLWDKAIEQTKELIAYKEKQKKGLMQNLLTGKKRLHGFNDKWKTYKLGEVAETYGGLTNKTKNDFGNEGNKYISYLEIYQNYYLKKPTNNYVIIKNNEKQTELKYGDILFTLSSEIPEEVGISCVILFEPREKIYLNSFSFCLRLKENNILHPLFSAYIFRAEHLRQSINKFAQGATRYNLSKANFLKLNITIPTSLDEQKAIADILCKADEEIELLNKQLDLYTEQKKGLMQNLLTGKVRVTV